MTNQRDYIWECDYGEHSRFIDILKIIVSEQNADELGMCALFVNNNPYNLEFYVVLSYEHPKGGQVEKMLGLMTGAGARMRPDIPMSDLMSEMLKKRYNSVTIVDSMTLDEAKNGLFQFKERSEVAKVISMRPLGNRIPVFLSHASPDKPIVEDVIPYLSRHGLPVWYDKISIDYGENIVSAVQSGIVESGAVIFFVTSNFLNSSWCRREMQSFLGRYAGGQNVLILTVVAEDVNHNDLPLFLQEIKYLKLDGEFSPQTVANELVPVLTKRFGTR
ncbi:toll/interleukin-1 receptor domain-containing protein [Vibrio fluvialis]|uniref:toll/interleukin-1 receptor domain-containing protein n=1 Tax=Vibrio navarrensis TaxID=29495 RepID=UPI0015592DD5|nr:toll/interleukin-1 receptor domain-containing protein [Vibrio navarrensis]ELI1841574.1 toll/interleukin-1 receptor domain-containing protein [Vibrio fluvialis]